MIKRYIDAERMNFVKKWRISGLPMMMHVVSNFADFSYKLWINKVHNLSSYNEKLYFPGSNISCLFL